MRAGTRLPSDVMLMAVPVASFTAVSCPADENSMVLLFLSVMVYPLSETVRVYPYPSSSFHTPFAETKYFSVPSPSVQR